MWFLLALLLLLISSCATSLHVNTTEVASPQVPREFDGFLILFLSDLHINDMLPRDYFEKVLDKVVALKPDLILLGGDFVDGNTSDVRDALQLLEVLPAEISYAVLGNHDSLVSTRLITEELEALGITLLDNRSLRVEKEGAWIVLAGVGDYYFDVADSQAALEGIETEEFCLFLSHTPDLYPRVREDERVDLMLAGHTHGGQVTLFGLWAPFMPLWNKKYWRGSYRSEINQLIISNGVGVSKLPLRIFAAPALERIVLTRGEKDED